MTKKNSPERFTVKFNPSDPCHQKTVDILNKQGRHKAQFIVNAVMHYLNCPETPDIPQSLLDVSLIEDVVRRILESQSKEEMKLTVMPSPPERTIRQSESISINEAQNLLGEDGIAAIAKSMASFRNK